MVFSIALSSAAINWKTTALGVAAIIGVAAHCYATGSAPSANDIATILAGFGLVAAQDAK